MGRLKRNVGCGLGVVVLVAWAAAAQPRPVGFDDLMAMKAVQTPVVSPDGGWVLYTVRQWEPAGRDGEEAERWEARSHIWRVATGPDAQARQLTFSDRGESAPTWSPDGQWIAFLSARGESGGDRPEGEGSERPAQIWIMRADGGEAWKLTDAPGGIVAYAWAPDSRRIAFTAREPLAPEVETRRRRRDDARIFEGEFRRTHLWVVDVASKAVERLTEGTAFTVRGALSWAPDGNRLVFVAAPTPLVRDVRDDVYVLTVPSKALEKLTTNPGPDRAAAWSPDGQFIAYLSEPAGPMGADGMPLQDIRQERLMLYDVASRTARDVSTGAFDLAVGAPIWTPDSRRILFVTGARAYRDVFAYDLPTNRFVQLTRQRVVTLGPVSRDGTKVAFLMEGPTMPADVYISDLTFAAPRRVTDANPQVRSFALGETETIVWKSQDGWEIEGLLLKPVGYQPGRRVPLLVVVHGGPTGAFVNTFRATPGDPGQHWAGQGWAVFYPNPRGSTNYGERFMRANLLDWGGGDYRDIMAGVDAVIARGVADPEKLAIMGWSYGGYMTCWIVTQTARFKAAMMGAGLSNLWSMYGTNDIPTYLAAFFSGIPTRQTLPLYLERSGLTHVERVTTPLLILHGANDERVPVGQAMEFYRALKDRGKTVELVVYPREGHGLTEYYHQLDRLRRQFEWITRYTLGDTRKTTSQ